MHSSCDEEHDECVESLICEKLILTPIADSSGGHQAITIVYCERNLWLSGYLSVLQHNDARITSCECECEDGTPASERVEDPAHCPGRSDWVLDMDEDEGASCEILVTLTD